MPLTVSSHGSNSELGLSRQVDAPRGSTPQDPSKPLIVLLSGSHGPHQQTWRHEDMKTACSTSPAETVGPIPQKNRNLSWLARVFNCWASNVFNSKAWGPANKLWQRPKPGQLSCAGAGGLRGVRPWCHQFGGSNNQNNCFVFLNVAKI